MGLRQSSLIDRIVMGVVKKKNDELTKKLKEIEK